MSVTWNPADKDPNIALLNGNLTATNTTQAWHGVRCTMNMASGKRQVEITIGQSSSPVVVGISTPSWSLSSELGGTYSWGYKSSGVKKSWSTEEAYGASYGPGDIIGICLDLKTSSISLEFFKNGVSQGVAYTGISRIYKFHAAIGLYGINDAGTANFGATTFAYPVDGYESWEDSLDLGTVAGSIGQENPSYIGKAFDHVLIGGAITDSWYAYWDGANRTTGWIGQNLGSAKIVDEYRMWIEPDIPSYAPKTWTFEGADEPTFATPTVLDTITDAAPPAGVWTHYMVANTIAYQYYRLNVTANNGGNKCIITELEFCEAAPQPPSEEIALEDIRLYISTVGLDLEALMLMLSTITGDQFEALRTHVSAVGLTRESLAMYLSTARGLRQYLRLHLSATDGVVLEALRLLLSTTDGTACEAVRMYLSARRSPPAFRSVVAQRLPSVMSEAV